LAQRFSGLGEVPAPPQTPQNIPLVGDSATFFVQNFATGVFEISAELVYANEVVYMWVQEGYNLDPNLVKRSADAFAERIYGPTRAVFGNEASPGIDGDPVLYILHAELGQGVGAYYYSESQYPRAAVSTSNEHEMFFVNLENIGRSVGTDYYDGVLAHEFQHMIHWAIDANEESWLNEGLSELATYLVGYGVSDFADIYLHNTQTQITYWPEGANAVTYGAAFLFSAYFLQRYGLEAIKELVAHEANGMESFQETLATLRQFDPIDGQPMTAERLFMDFSVANLLHNPRIADGQYGYNEADLQALSLAQITQEIPSPVAVQLIDQTLNPWSVQYYRVRPTGEDSAYQISFTGNEFTSILPVDPFSGSYAWWSNRVDNSDTTLTRAFDLSAVATATLRFQAWYDIEADWDYAYVVVSTDGGITWTPLTTERTTTTNPHNNSYGAAYTGESGGWVEEVVDLSAYAGKQISLRFEYITDDATIENGFLLDDVAIPEIGFFDDFETPDPAWTAEGWVRIQNRLKQSFALQMIVNDRANGTRVERMLLPESPPQAEWEIPLGAHEVVFVVSAFAPVTTEPAYFSLTVSPTD
jgi:hypothetical protein